MSARPLERGEGATHLGGAGQRQPAVGAVVVAGERAERAQRVAVAAAARRRPPAVARALPARPPLARGVAPARLVVVRRQRVQVGVVEALVVAVAVVVVALVAGVVAGLVLVAPAGRAVAGVVRQAGPGGVVVVVVGVLVQAGHRTALARRVAAAALHGRVPGAAVAGQVARRRVQAVAGVPEAVPEGAVRHQVRRLQRARARRRRGPRVLAVAVRGAAAAALLAGLGRRGQAGPESSVVGGRGQPRDVALQEPRQHGRRAHPLEVLIP